MLKNEVFEQYGYLFKKKLTEGILALDDDLDHLVIPRFYYPLKAYCDGIEATICLKFFEAFEGVEDYDVLHKMAEYFFVDSDGYFDRVYNKDYTINYEEREKIFNEIDEFIANLTQR